MIDLRPARAGAFVKVVSVVEPAITLLAWLDSGVRRKPGSDQNAGGGGPMALGHHTQWP